MELRDRSVADGSHAVDKKPIELDRPVACSKCAHVTPYIKGWMVSAVMHHIIAVHGGNTKLLGRH